MKRTALLLALAASIVACSTPTTTAKTAASEADKANTEDDFHMADQADLDGESDLAASTKDADRRNVGDYVTFAFSGSYLKSKVVLTERVVDKDGDSITIDFAFTASDKTDTWRVRSNLKSGAVHAVSQQAKDGSFTEASPSDFEAKMAGTVAVADENEALIDEDRTAITVAGKALEVRRATYQVRVGKKAGKLTTLTKEGFAWGDVGGELVTSDGKTLYKAELVDLGAGASKTASIAP